ncbi:UBA-like protein, partial [Tanacetum coccineum]
MEMKFKCSKQEVERAIVACEGDLEQAAETLKNQKQEQPPTAPPKLEENGDPLTIANGPSSVDPGIKSLQLLKKIPPN